MSRPTGARSNAQRWVTTAFGVLFVGIAIAIVYLSASDYPLGAYAAAIAVGGLGIDALISAARNRRSILSRIGPLP